MAPKLEFSACFVYPAAPLVEGVNLEKNTSLGQSSTNGSLGGEGNLCRMAIGLTAILGAGISTTAGGLLGVLAHAGVPEEEAAYYAEGIRRGGALLTAQVDDTRENEARSILLGFVPVEINARAADWKQAGWTEYSPDAERYSSAQIAAERERYQPTSMEQGSMRAQKNVTFPSH